MYVMSFAEDAFRTKNYNHVNLEGSASFFSELADLRGMNNNLVQIEDEEDPHVGLGYSKLASLALFSQDERADSLFPHLFMVLCWN
jgi:hypothetical protein